MKTAGIIAEYNPFHNGHLYQIETVRKTMGCDRVIVIMSGDFVQRGAPACMDKFSRCRAALECGADMVIELPCLGAVSSANIFAAAAVSVLNSLGNIDFLCFGCENDDDSFFRALARLLNDEPDDYRLILKSHLGEGLSYPSSRALAASEILSGSGYPPEYVQTVLREPNNILAVEYYRALDALSSSIQPVPILRKGASHNNPHENGVNEHFLSSSAIRAMISSGYINGIRESVPEHSFSSISDNAKNGAFISADDFTQIISYSLLVNSGRLNEYCDVSDDLANRIEDAGEMRSTLGEYIDCLSSRNITRSRICRALFHIVLGHGKSLLNDWQDMSYAGYFHVLGFRKESSDIFRSFRHKAAGTMVVRAGDMGRLSGTPLRICENDVFASKLYRSVLCSKYGIKKLPVLSEPVIAI